MEGYGDNNNNNDDGDHDDHDGDDDDGGAAGLPRCTAIATTTKLRCKKLVSFAGEQFCPTHGGRQHRDKVEMAMCQAVSKTTRKPCKRRVGFTGEQYCSHHGGRKVSEANTIRPTAPPMPMPNPTPLNPTNVTAPMDPLMVARFMHQLQPQPAPIPAQLSGSSPAYNWLNLAHQCVEFLSDTHPRMMAENKCGCDHHRGRLCRSMQIIKWVQLLIKLTQEHGFVDPTSIRNPQAFVPLMASHLFGDLYTAVAIFGATSIDFLPTLFSHMRTLNVNVNNANTSGSSLLSPAAASPSLHSSMSSIASWSQIAPTLNSNLAAGNDNDDDDEDKSGHSDECF